MIGFLIASVALVVWFWRRRLLSITCVGAYTTMFLVTNYVGVVLSYFGYNILLIDFQYSEADAWRAVILLHLGIACVWLGVFYVDHFLYHDRPINWKGLFANPRIPVGMSVDMTLVLFVVAAGGFFLLFMPLLPRFISLALHGDLAAKLDFRLKVTAGSSYTYALTVLAYDIIPYLSLSLLLISWRTGTFRMVSPVSVAITSMGLLYGFLKQPLVVYFLLLAIASNWSAPWRKRLLSIRLRHRIRRPRNSIWLGFSLSAILLLGLYYWLVGMGQSGSFGQRLEITTGLMVSRLLFRSPVSYIYVASLIPSKIPFVGLTNISTIQSLVGGTFHNLDTDLFARAHPGYTEGGVSLDSLCNHYAQFGWIGLAIGAFLQGLGIAMLDRFIAGRPRDLGLMVFALFMVKSAGYLNATHVFGTLLGYGGLFSVGLYIILKQRRVSHYGELPQMQRELPSAT